MHSLGLLITGFSPTYAAGGGIAAVVAASCLTRKYRMKIRDMFAALVLGTRNAAPTALLLVCTGLIIGSLNMTGTGVAFSHGWSGGNLLAALALIAGASLILGMGLSVTAGSLPTRLSSTAHGRRGFGSLPLPQWGSPR